MNRGASQCAPKQNKEEPTMKSKQALSVEEMKLKVFINKLDASFGTGTRKTSTGGDAA